MPVMLRFGTSGYSYKEWKGSFYPSDLSAKRMLHFYGEQFTAVESNSTFRTLPSETAVSAWAKEVPATFKFALKAPQQITHFRRLQNVEAPAAFALNPPEHPCDRIIVVVIARDARDSVGQRSAVDAPAGGIDARAGVGERNGDATPDTAAGAGDECGVSGKRCCEVHAFTCRRSG